MSIIGLTEFEHAEKIPSLRLAPRTNGASQSAVDTRRAIAKLERAVMELRMGMLGMRFHPDTFWTQN